MLIKKVGGKVNKFKNYAMLVVSFSTEGPQLTVDLILEVTQICCFPFAVDATDDLLAQIQV